jgi:pre-mRNA-splicing factor SYF2
MSTALKRKGSPSLEEDAESPKRRFAEEAPTPQSSTTTDIPAPQDTPAEAPQPTPPAKDDRASRFASRFAALRARSQSSRQENLQEARNEAKRQATDPSQLASLNRKRDIAEHNLLKAEVQEEGGDFERKRAWDWTAEESERWDRRLEEKKRKREENLFQDYSREAGKVYERQIAGLEKGESAEGRREAYEKEKNEAIERAVRSGGLEIVETADGELIAVDKDGSFYSTADTATAHIANKPDKAAVDRLVADIKKAEEVRLQKRRARGKDDQDGGDVTYINEKNKQFNLKLARFYNKYTADIRESFERGTAI